uniref:NADH dehydrogenase subunit 1 n=1 Tax=Hexostoma thynni TaxID=92220 RepID=UPI0022372A3D|nr:NADH dehydrogenase subunit 1 [Hexostoma thynni]UYC28905.1 NADH dehydrogenase subunit 1 [Hexostoma thynni]
MYSLTITNWALAALGVVFYVLVVVLFFLLVFFFVLVERKVLGVTQSRVGPQKVSFLGVLQSLADFLKLGGKGWVLHESVFWTSYRSILFWGGVAFFVIAAVSLSLIFVVSSTFYLDYNGIHICWVIVLSSISGYGFILSGLGSESKYSLYGAMRAAFVGVSFEGSLMCIVILVGLMYGGYNFHTVGAQLGSSLIPLFPIYLLSLACFLCECNRSPFDYSESESDLVSGFNTDFFGIGFAFLFASEYLIMVFFIWLVSYLFFCSYFLYFAFFLHSYIFIYVRSCFPRSRYDLFVSFLWKSVFIFYFFYILLGLVW